MCLAIALSQDPTFVQQIVQVAPTQVTLKIGTLVVTDALEGAVDFSIESSWRLEIWWMSSDSSSVASASTTRRVLSGAEGEAGVTEGRFLAAVTTLGVEVVAREGVKEAIVGTNF